VLISLTDYCQTSGYPLPALIYSISSADWQVEVLRHQVEVGFVRMFNAAESGGGRVVSVCCGYTDAYSYCR
jgi:hypothetical protein